MAALEEGAIFAVENPLLDISAEVPIELVQKYNLSIPNACLAEESHLPLFDELVSNYPVEYIAGGGTQNVMRAVAWLTQVKNIATFVGCVGKDEFGKKLEKAIEEDGVKPAYLYDETAPTGTCACLIVKHERSLVANLGAANKYQKSHFDSEEIQAALHKAKFLYSSGFFLTVSPDTLVALGEHAAQYNKIFMYNLAAPFLIQFFTDQMLRVLPYTDIIIGNEIEGRCFGERFNFGSTLQEIALRLCNEPKVNKERKRIVIFTQGPNPAIIAHDGVITEYPVIKTDDREIVDLNGAGDSYSGGFLAGLVSGKSISQAVESANYVANCIIKTSGIKFHGKPNFHFSE